MIKTTTKLFNSRLNAYVLDHVKDAYDMDESDRIQTVADAYRAMHDYFIKCCPDYRKPGDFDSFEYWAQGLPCGGLFDYYLYRDDCNAIDLLGDMLEQTKEERQKYTLEQSSKRLTQLIYRNMVKEIRQ